VGLFDKVERGLERAVNSAFAKAFKSEVQPVELASAVRRAMDDRAAVMGHGRTMVPNLYTIELSGTDFERLSGYEEALSDELVAAAQEHADSQRYQPGGPVQISFHRDDELETGVFRVRPATSRRSIAPSTEAPRRETVPPAQNAPVVAPPRRPTTSPVARPWLVIDGERYPLIGAHTVIGRDELADVVLDDPGISRRHCEIRVTNDGPHLVTSVRDLGSTNGTFVNGERITSTRLDEGDEITIGRTHAVFRPGKR
jgi:pSer/pThr/pTyr-binding forkhead associated (FHA) protein